MRRTGFTEIEVVVVVGILAILFGILSPVLRTSKEHAKAVKCAHNIKQLQLAFSAYANNHSSLPYGFNGNTLLGAPPQGEYAGNQVYDKPGWWWFNYIGIKYEVWQEQDNVLCCPAKRIIDPIFRKNVLWGNYGVNQSICKIATGRRIYSEYIGTPSKLIDIKEPGRTMLIADAGYALVNWWHVTEIPPVSLGSKPVEDSSYIPGLSINEKRTLRSEMVNDAVYGRHLNKKVNIGFVDGHVEFLPAEFVLIEKLNDDYKNHNPLWCTK